MNHKYVSQIAKFANITMAADDQLHVLLTCTNCNPSMGM